MKLQVRDRREFAKKGVRGDTVMGVVPKLDHRGLSKKVVRGVIE